LDALILWLLKIIIKIWRLIYNFSRRYLPDQNITSFLRPQQQYIENANRRESIPMDSNFQNLENLPIID